MKLALAIDPGASALRDGSATVVAASPALRALFRETSRLAWREVPIVLLGESGSGKEILARHLHEAGPRSAGPFCAVNCAALPAQLVESTLFGHERGAFTGANLASKGLFVAAHGGTLLLDEIADLHPAAQASLLRVLETKLVRALGAALEVRVDVRVLAATNLDLEAMVESGRFRRDLFYRLAAITLRVPPLRERPEDLAALTALFVRDACARWRRAVPRLSPGFLAALMAHPWPGNVRELRNAIERALVLADGESLDPAHLPERLRAGSGADARSLQRGAFATNLDDAPLAQRLAAYEAASIEEALQHSGGNRTLAAAKLGMPRRTLTRRMAKYGLQ